MSRKSIKHYTIAARRSKAKVKNPRFKIWLPNILIAFITWAFLIFMFTLVDPATSFVRPLFFVIIFVTVLATLNIFIRKIQTKVIISGTVVIFLILRYFKIGNFINFFLLVGIASTILLYEYYTKKSD